MIIMKGCLFVLFPSYDLLKMIFVSWFDLHWWCLKNDVMCCSITYSTQLWRICEFVRLLDTLFKQLYFFHLNDHLSHQLSFSSPTPPLHSIFLLLHTTLPSFHLISFHLISDTWKPLTTVLVHWHVRTYTPSLIHPCQVLHVIGFFFSYTYLFFFFSLFIDLFAVMPYCVIDNLLNGSQFPFNCIRFISCFPQFPLHLHLLHQLILAW